MTTASAGFPVHPTSGPAPFGAASPRGHAVGSEHRLGGTSRPPGMWARAVGGCHSQHARCRPSVAVRCRSSTTHCPQAMWQCVATFQLPTTPPGSVAVHFTSSTAQRPRQCGNALQQFHYLLHLGGVAVDCRISTAQCPHAAWQCIIGVSLPTAPRQCGSALQQFHCPLPKGSVELHYGNSTAPKQCGSTLQHFHCLLPQGNVEVHYRSSTAPCPQAAWHCVAAVPLHTAPTWCSSALHEFHCPLPTGSVAVHCMISTAHCPLAVWQCIGTVPLSTAPGHCGGVLHDFHRPLPAGSVAVHWSGSAANCPQAVWRSIA